jgi:hypothetical protein
MGHNIQTETNVWDVLYDVPARNSRSLHAKFRVPNIKDPYPEEGWQRQLRSLSIPRMAFGRSQERKDILQGDKRRGTSLGRSLGALLKLGASL